LDVLLLNIHRVSYIDPTLDKCSAAYEWLSSSDLYRSHTKGGLDTHALEDMHIPAAAGAIHVLCRVEQKQDLLYTTRDFSEARYKLDANLALAHKFAEGISFRSRATRGTGQLTNETIPYALWILSAGKGNGALDKAVTSVELLSKGEQKSFRRHVDALRTLGLSYVTEQEGLGSRDHGHNFLKLRLEPPIERLVQFADLDDVRLDIPSQLKEMLSREAVHERLRDRGGDPMQLSTSPNSEFSSQHVTAVAGNCTTSTTQTTSTASKRPSPVQEPEEPTKKHKAANFLTIGAQKAKTARSARSAARVGFQRANTNNQNKLSNSGSGVPLQHVVRFRYVKGFTQAVRTPCVLEDLT
jgi:chromosome transmission fidelity protein 18